MEKQNKKKYFKISLKNYRHLSINHYIILFYIYALNMANFNLKMYQRSLQYNGYRALTGHLFYDIRFPSNNYRLIVRFETVGSEYMVHYATNELNPPRDQSTVSLRLSEKINCSAT